MSKPPLLAADGLPARRSGPWIHQKYLVLDRYSGIFTTGMKARHDDFPRGLSFVDLMSGPGVCVDTRSPGQPESPGSTLRALATVDPFRCVVAVDSNPLFIQALDQRTATSSRRASLHLWSDDCNSAGTINQIRDLTYGTLTLMFVDLLGTEVAMDTVRALTTDRRVDLLITWPEMDVVRNKGLLLAQPDRWERFFGTKDWRAVAELTGPRQRVDKLRTLYCEQLKRLGYETAFAPAVENSRRGRLYRPLFASRNERGLQFFSIAMQPVQPPPKLWE